MGCRLWVLGGRSARLNARLILRILRRFKRGLIGLLVIRHNVLVLRRRARHMALLANFRVLALVGIRRESLLRRLFLHLMNGLLGFHGLRFLIRRWYRITFRNERLKSFHVTRLRVTSNLRRFFPIRVNVMGLIIGVRYLRRLLYCGARDDRPLSAPYLCKWANDVSIVDRVTSGRVVRIRPRSNGSVLGMYLRLVCQTILIQVDP